MANNLSLIVEGLKMWEKCKNCQTSKTRTGDIDVPPSEEWIDEDEECQNCDVIDWFRAHA